MLLIVTACGGGRLPPPSGGGGEGNNPPTKEITEIKGSELCNKSLVKWQGRTYYDTSKKEMVLYNTASGFEVSFIGSTLYATLTTTNTTNSSSFVKFIVMIDEQTANQGQVVTLSSSSSTVTLASKLSFGKHTAKVYKASEGQDGVNAVSSISTSSDGAFETAPTEASMKVLVIGGSGISGHGSLGVSGQDRTTANSSSIHSFGYLVAEYFKADFQFVSNSGWGVKYGSNPTNNNGEVNLLTAIDYIGIDNNERIVKIPYDMSSYKADIVVVNAGGNDYTGYINKLSGSAKETAERAFQQAVVEMCTKLKNTNPNCIIIWTYTDIETGKPSKNGQMAKSAIETISGYENYIFPTLIAQVGSFNEPSGANNHAGKLTHIRNANYVIEKINNHVKKS